jgi:hypothetical protein
LSLVKFIVSAVLAVIFLYFTITGIQNVMQAKEELDLANKQADYWKRQVVEENRFYESHACTKTSSETYSCPPGTPDFVPTEPEPTK